MADINNSNLFIKPNHSLQSYYNSFKSQIGYKLMLGETRHYSYYPAEAKWPFPITRALRAIEDHLFNSLNLSARAIVLNAGYRVGHIAIYIAKKGLRVFGIDVVNHHLTKANRNIKAENFKQQVSAQKMDYYYLDGLQNNLINGVYTIETLVYVTDLGQVLYKFYQVLKPEGSVILHKYDFKFSKAPKYLKDAINKINTFASMPVNRKFKEGVLPQILEDIGF